MLEHLLWRGGNAVTEPAIECVPWPIRVLRVALGRLERSTGWRAYDFAYRYTCGREYKMVWRFATIHKIVIAN